ncbi:MAG: LXG domain-containing protein [Lachnospiraceae bacterium]|jgi:hypothetical protein|nr:LXG domain-containing protein [Lachnospiraceae bacterium]
MSYRIDYQEMISFHYAIQGFTNNYKVGLEELTKSVREFIYMDSFKGTTAKQVKDYMNEVNRLVIKGMMVLHNELSNVIGVYIDGYRENIDPDENTVIDCNSLEELIFDFHLSHQKFIELNNELNYEVDSSVINLPQPTGGAINALHEKLINDLKDLRTRVGEREMAHQSDLSEFYQLASSLNNFMEAHAQFHEDVSKLPFSMPMDSMYEAMAESIETKEHSFLLQELTSLIIELGSNPMRWLAMDAKQKNEVYRKIMNTEAREWKVLDDGQKEVLLRFRREYALMNVNPGVCPYLISSWMMSDFGWEVSFFELLHIRDVLTRYNITNMNSIMMFMATCAHESGRGTHKIELLNEDDTTVGENTVEARGASYIQLTHEENHEAFLEKMGDTYSEANTAEHISENYDPWEVSAWYWSEFETSLSTKYIKDYVIQYGNSLGVFFVTQSIVNGWPYLIKDGKPVRRKDDSLIYIDNAIMVSIRDGEYFPIIKKNGTSSSFEYTNGQTYTAPRGWDEREKRYHEANEIFK